MKFCSFNLVFLICLCIQLKAPHSPRPEHKTFVINTKTLPTPPKTPHMKKKAPTFPSPDLSTNSTDTIRSNELSGNDEKSNRDVNGNIKTKNRNQPDYQEIKTKAQLHRPHVIENFFWYKFIGITYS